MAKSFFLSIFFHLLIIFSFLVSPNLFNLKKKSMILEIPVEIIEISKKTQSKQVKVKKVSEEKQQYTPPKAIKKPVVPEFIKKKKTEKIKKKREEKKIVEEKIKVNRLSSIFNSIDEIKQKNTLNTKKEEKKEEINSNLIGEKLSISEIDLIRNQFIPCWTIPAGAKGLSSLVIKVNLKLDNLGNVVSSKIINKYNLKNPSHRTLAESVIRAIKHPACRKIRVPSKKYDVWKNITLNFDPSEIESQ